MYKKIISIIVILSLTLSSYATHLVGGEITYTHVSGNTYQVTLIVYRDGLSGGAAFDNPATLHLYTTSGNYITSYDFSLSNPSTSDDAIPNPYPNPCLTPPANIMIQKGIYTHNITVPNGSVNYELLYGRCCRNPIIDNLTNPDEQGSMFSVRIPASNIYNNSTPTFDVVPPIFVCLGSALEQDQSATDIDGDSLYYSLCDPITALTSTNPMLNSGTVPPAGFGPPFNPVVWLPPYNVNNQLGGIPLTIDGNTGLVSGIPNSLGTYVVGLCVEEYRNGVFLSRVLRDFQYTVSTCNIPTASIPIIGSIDVNDLPLTPNIPATILGIYTKNCENLIVDFDNQSTLPGGVPANNTNADFWWDFGDGTTSTDFEPIHTFPDTGTYVVQLAIIQGAETSQPCVDTGYYVVYVYPIFSPDFIFDNVCNSDSAHFFDVSTTATYDGTNEWDWSFGDGSAHSLVQNPEHIYSSPGTYQVTMFARTERGCTKIDTNSITIYPNPDAVFLNPSPICIGNEYHFNSQSNISSGTIDSIFWNMGDNVISYTDSFNTYMTDGIYPIQLVVSSDFGCLDSVSHNLIVNGLPIITTSGNDTICPNSLVQVSASGGIFYEWTPANLIINPSVSNPFITPDTPSYFYVEVIDVNNCVNNDSLYIDFLPLPDADAGEDTSVCLNIADLLVFNQSVPMQASGGVSYTWTPIAGLDNPNISNPIATPVVNTIYIVEVTDVNNCVNTDSIEVTVLNPALELIQVITDSLCFGDTVVVDVLDQGTISNYSWSPITFVTDPFASEPGFFPPVTTSYTLTIQNYCYQDNDSVLIEVIPIQSLDAGPLDSICLDDSPYQLNANPTNFEIYNWTSSDNSISNPNIPNPTIQPTISSTYYLFIVDSVGTLACTNTDSVEILVFNNPTLNITTPIDYFNFICQGDSVLLTANSNDAIIFDWDIDASLSSLNTQTTYAFPSDTNEYFVTVENVHACTNRDSIIINVQKPVFAEIEGDSIMCFGFYVDLEAKEGLYYQWYPTNANFSNENHAVTQVYLDNDMQIFVDVSNDCFHDTAYKFITVSQLPVVDAGEDKYIIRDDFSTFLDGSGDGKPLWYTEQYTFEGLLNSPAQYSPEAQPFSTTTYVLEIENPITGCKNYDTMVVNVEVVTLLAFPTAFSPNGDGVNDFAHILKHLNIKSLDDFSIYNRYGELVFKTTDFKSHWDGTYKGVDQENGVFTWNIRATTKDNDSIIRTGNITLVR